MTSATNPPQSRVSDAGRLTPRHLATSPVLRGIVGTIVIVAIIDACIAASPYSEETLPRVTTVIAAFFRLIVDPAFLSQVATTMVAVVLSLAICVVAGVGLGLVIGRAPLVQRLTMPILELLRPMPPVALIPLVIVALGLGLALQTTLGVIAGIWAILFNTIYGVAGLSTTARDSARTLNITGPRQVFTVALPNAFPLICVGVRLAASSILIVVVATELLAGSRGGIGAFILTASSTTRVDEALAATAVAGLIGLIINTALEAVERRWVSWRSA